MIDVGATDYNTVSLRNRYPGKARIHRAIESVLQRDQMERDKKYTTLGLMSAGISSRT